jgi:ankyrin repeat protein
MKFREELLAAIYEDNLDAFRTIADRESDILSMHDYLGRNLLHWAAQEGSTEIGKWLILRAPRLLDEVEDDGQTPLRIASGEGHVEMVLLLLKMGASVKTPGDSKCGSALDSATAYGHEVIIAILTMSKEERDRCFG